MDRWNSPNNCSPAAGRHSVGCRNTSPATSELGSIQQNVCELPALLRLPARGPSGTASAFSMNPRLHWAPMFGYSRISG
ncbi:hypothetical protein ACTXG6_12045 [Pseudonocardia sp. Cha107L01]|uniref:hypothetical protein n=1 Tax=Pseudonocardia sp. Cha107L01 TaxID=3457576 RepID=UPI00403E8F7E